MHNSLDLDNDGNNGKNKKKQKEKIIFFEVQIALLDKKVWLGLMVLDGLKGKRFFEYVVLFNQGLEGVFLIIFSSR